LIFLLEKFAARRYGCEKRGWNGFSGSSSSQEDFEEYLKQQ
jgi:hypothetical protein